ncbi:MAG: tetratricopeptide repeat protein [Sterolibacterium sp.]|jgi:tetratricopeptide (TPR) repeat protein
MTDNRDWVGKHYLVIDDFPGMRMVMCDMLRSLGVKHADQAGNGAEASAMLAKTKYDVVLCDFDLGFGRSGQQVLEEARLLDLVGPSCIWLMVSADRSAESIMGAAEFQPDAYLCKPITENLLLTRLNHVWSKKQVFQEIDAAFSAKDYIKAAKLCDEKIATCKLHALDLLRMKASLLMKSADYAAAQKVYEQILADREYGWAKTGLARIHLHRGDYQAAKLMLQEVLAENANYLDAYDHLALTLEKLGEFAEAEKVLGSAVKLSPNSVLRQLNLGTIALRLGDLSMAEKAFHKCIDVGKNSIRKTPDAYFGLARVCGQKEHVNQALEVLADVQAAFVGEDVSLRAKITEGLVYHEAGDFSKARKTSEEAARMLEAAASKPNIEASLETARLFFAVGVKNTPINLLRDLVRNNHDSEALAIEVQKIFDQAHLGDIGSQLVASSRKEAEELMNHGVLLWKGGKPDEALAWMRNAKAALPSNVRVLFNCAHIMIAKMQEEGFDSALAGEAREILLKADQLSPNHKRFAELMELLQGCRPSDQTQAA